jgi:hypothetical protein
MFFDDLKNVTSVDRTVTPDLKNVTPGLTRGPFYLMNAEMKEQNGFRIESGMTSARLTMARIQ